MRSTRQNSEVEILKNAEAAVVSETCKTQIMTASGHTFHIPVMGTGHSIDTPIRVGHFGVSSVISLVDDILIDRVGRYYRERFELEPVEISRSDDDGRAKRITAYLDAVATIVQKKIAGLKALPFVPGNEKSKYFELLPDTSMLKREYERLLKTVAGPERDEIEKRLDEGIRSGSIDVNIMVKLDRTNYGRDGKALPEEFSDSLAALRGFAKSCLESKLVLSAGINQKLFAYMSRFNEFYRDQSGRIRKQIVIKVSDFRSALLQAKVLAKKGLEVSEFRVESGLNCGGHAFAANGLSLPCVLGEFRDRLGELSGMVKPLIRKFYAKQGRELPEGFDTEQPLVSVQGGIGTQGEVARLREEFGIEQTGWGSPFLLVPEATCLDDETRELLRESEQSDLYLSDVSPLGIPFNNLRGTGSEKRTKKAVEKGDPGSPCPKGYLVSSSEFGERPLCPASRSYQKQKLEQIEAASLPDGERETKIAELIEKTCICDHLGNPALIALGLVKAKAAPQCVCPGPNVAWFNRIYSLREMIDHIYGRGESLVAADRPHMFAKEVTMLVDYFGDQLGKYDGSNAAGKILRQLYENIRLGLAECARIAKKSAFENENLSSIPECLAEQEPRLERLREQMEGLLEERMEAVVA